MTYQLLTGDNRKVLRTLPEKSIHAIICSPPYFNLRAYAGDQALEWEAFDYSPMPGVPPISIPAWRGGLGNEPTIEMFIGHLVLCLRDWWRVLRDDGCCFVNLGDSYNSGSSGGLGGSTLGGGQSNQAISNRHGRGYIDGLKPKDLCMVPARFALAAQADGWYVRSDIIWAKGVSFLADYAGSSMPESVQDRPSKSHEYIYLLTKQPRYFWDNEAVKEPALNRTVWPEVGKTTQAARRQLMSGGDTKTMDVSTSRSLRSVWVINPQPWPGAHFAVWPASLVEPMIKASTSEHGVCAECGAPWKRVVERKATEYNTKEAIAQALRNQGVQNGGVNKVTLGITHKVQKITLGWQPTCACNAAIVPATVLDPFGGSGTTAAAACALGRNAISIDLSSEYIALQEDRIREAINASGRAYIQPVCKATDYVDLPMFSNV